VVTLILAGIAVAAVGGALAGFLSVIADDPRLGSPLFYSLGGLGVATWRLVGVTLPIVAIGLLVLPREARRLDLILLGEREAAHLGVDVEALRRRVLLLVTLTVGATVAAAGVIGFVGLLVPLIRLVVARTGSCSASALGAPPGGWRRHRGSLGRPEIVGLLTALQAAAFLWLRWRTRHEHGGWG
jgi:iron complex transport system permease protein